MHEIDRTLMEKNQEFFPQLCGSQRGIGYISKANNNLVVEFRVSTLNDISNVIIPHFDKYPLLTLTKQADYILFKEIILLLLNKEHSTLEGIKKIVNIKASLNTGLTEILKEFFPDILTSPKESLVPCGRIRPLLHAASLRVREKDGVGSNIPLANKLKPEWMAGFCTGESNFFITGLRTKI